MVATGTTLLQFNHNFFSFLEHDDRHHGPFNGWYRTNTCGYGYVHQSQLRFN
jgi:hypothetical protein